MNSLCQTQEERDLLTQYAVLQDKADEIKYRTKAAQSKIEDSINLIESLHNLYLPDENKLFAPLTNTEQKYNGIYKISPSLEPAFLTENFYHPFSIPLQINDRTIKRIRNCSVHLLCDQIFTGEISLIDVHTIPGHLVIGGSDQLIIYNLNDGSVEFNWNSSISTSNQILSISLISPNNIAVGFQDGFVRIINVRAQRIVSEFLVSTSPITSLFYSSKQILFCHAQNGEISSWKGENCYIQGNTIETFVKFIEDPTTNDVVIISDKKYHWDLNDNQLKVLPNETEVLPRFDIKPIDDKSLKFSFGSESEILSEIPKFAFFDFNHDYFCLATKKRFFIYSVSINELNEKEIKQEHGKGILRPQENENRNSSKSPQFPSLTNFFNGSDNN